MDTSEQYIKMCDCPEIQEQSKCMVGYSDLMKLWGHDQIDIDGYRKGSLQIDYHNNLFIHGWWRGKSSHLWLPRQDQIQEMIGKTESAYMIYPIGGRWGGEVYQDREQIFTIEMDSPEQLWLAFYMYEKHKETWDGEKWVA